MRVSGPVCAQPNVRLPTAGHTVCLSPAASTASEAESWLLRLTTRMQLATQIKAFANTPGSTARYSRASFKGDRPVAAEH